MVSLRRLGLLVSCVALVVFAPATDASRLLRSTAEDDELVEGSFDRPPPPPSDGSLDREGSGHDDSDGSLDDGPPPRPRSPFFHAPSDSVRSYEWRGSDDHSGSDEDHFLPRNGDDSRPFDDRDGSLDDGSDESSNDGYLAARREAPEGEHPDDLVDGSN